MKKERVVHELNGGHPVAYVRIPSGTCYHEETEDKVIRVMERLRKEGTVVRVFYGSPKTGRSWLGCYPIGRIGRSSGEIKVPLLVPEGEIGGGAILDHCVIRIDTQDGTVYKHPTFYVGDFTVKKNNGTYPWSLFVDGQLESNHSTNEAAIACAAFLHGSLFSRKPSRKGEDNDGE